MSNEKLKIQLEEKDKTIQNLRRAVEHLELKAGERNFADMQVSRSLCLTLSPEILTIGTSIYLWTHIVPKV